MSKGEELKRFSGQNHNGPFETILAEVGIEGESVVKSVMINQSEAGAIDKAKIFVTVPHKDRFGVLFHCLADTMDLDSGLIETFHEFDSRWVADSEANQGTGLREYEIRC